MRYGIVDNSTITAAQRLLGHIEVMNDYSVDGDLSAFENLVCAIIFYDSLFFIDDYKVDFREERQKQFSFLNPIQAEDFPYSHILNQARAAVSHLMLRIEGGVISEDEIGKFLASLRLHTTCTWDMHSSNFFLTMKMLEGSSSLPVERYTQLMEAIFSELQANRGTVIQLDDDRRPVLLDSDGRPIPRSQRSEGRNFEVTKQLYAFASSLNWLSLRSAFYTLIAGQLSADVILHPMRAAFQAAFSGAGGFEAGKFRTLLQNIRQTNEEVVKDVNSARDPVVAHLSLPIFSAWLVRETGRPSRILDAAFDLRHQEPFLSARQQLNEIEDLVDQGLSADRVKRINQLLIDVAKAAKQMRQKYCVETPNGFSLGPLTFLANIPLALNGLPSIPNLPFRIRLPQKLVDLKRRKGFSGLLRSITDDLTAVERLGALRDNLASEVKYHRLEPGGRRPAHTFKTEQQRYFGKASGWKRPM